MEKELSIGTRIDHEKYGEGIISEKDLSSYKVIFLRGGEIQFSKNRFEADILNEPEDADNTSEGLSLRDVERVLSDVLERYGSIQRVIPLGSKWEGGKMILKPGNESLKSKEVTIESFFHKIVMVRDRMRVLEQNLNSNKKLTDEEKVNLQQYITRIYGSLTTFNVLFEDKEDYFTGQRS
ncbi:MAG: hypothetical protein K9H84_07250 [Bacteroidales bacterium]|nr:hypothetical protein [Bacteroidales bacterium]